LRRLRLQQALTKAQHRSPSSASSGMTESEFPLRDAQQGIRAVTAELHAEQGRVALRSGLDVFFALSAIQQNGNSRVRSASSNKSAGVPRLKSRCDRPFGKRRSRTKFVLPLTYQSIHSARRVAHGKIEGPRQRPSGESCSEAIVRASPYASRAPFGTARSGCIRTTRPDRHNNR